MSRLAVPLLPQPNLSRLIVTLGAAQAFTTGFHLARAKITAVLVGPAGVGLISVIDQVVAVVTQLSLLTLPFASIKYLSMAHSQGQEPFARGFAAFFRAILGASLLGTAGGLAVALAKPSILGQELSGHLLLVTLGLLGIPLTGTTGLLTSTMAAAGRARASAAFGLGVAAATAGLSAGGILLAGLPGYYVGALAGALLAVGGGIYYLHRRERLRIRHESISVAAELRRDPATLRFAVVSAVSSFLTPLAYLVARYAVLGASGVRGAGLLQAVMGLSLAFGSVMRAGSAFFLTPAMNRADPPDRKFRLAAQYLRSLTVLASLGAVPVVLFPQAWIHAVYSREFTDAASTLYIFMLAQVLLLMNGVNSGLLIGLNRIGTHAVVAVVVDVSTAALSWYWAPTLSISGVGLALLASHGLGFSLTSYRLWTRDGMPVPRTLGWFPGLAVLSMALLGSAVFFFKIGTSDFAFLKVVLWLALGVLSLRYLQRRADGLPGEHTGREVVS